MSEQTDEVSLGKVDLDTLWETLDTHRQCMMYEQILKNQAEQLGEWECYLPPYASEYVQRRALFNGLDKWWARASTAPESAKTPFQQAVEEMFREAEQWLETEGEEIAYDYIRIINDESQPTLPPVIAQWVLERTVMDR